MFPQPIQRVKYRLGLFTSAAQAEVPGPSFQEPVQGAQSALETEAGSSASRSAVMTAVPAAPAALMEAASPGVTPPRA